MPDPFAPKTTSNGSFGGLVAIVAYFRILVEHLSIRAFDLAAQGNIALEGCSCERSQFPLPTSQVWVHGPPNLKSIKVIVRINLYPQTYDRYERGSQEITVTPLVRR